MPPIVMPTIDADDDATDALNNADDDAGSTDSQKSPHSLRNHNYAPNDATSPDSLIDPKLKRKIDPRSIIKLKF